jgi:integrase/recombinase XerD
MLVQRVLLPATRHESWTVLGDDGPVQPIERYLAYLTDIERSPNTVKAYAHLCRERHKWAYADAWVMPCMC